MKAAIRVRNLTALAALGLLVTATGCASRGYVRTQVGDRSDLLSAGITDNREEIERAAADLERLSAETRATDVEQDQQITETQAMITDVEAEVARVRDAAEGAADLASTADDRSLTLTRMFRDRSRYVVDESREIYFTFASAAIEPEHSETLQAVSDALRTNPDAILVLEGRTDSTGDPRFNTQLGQGRVDAARNYLVMEMGIPVYRIHGFSYGENQPDYDNEVAEEKAKNRSVKLLVLSPAPQTAVASLPE